MNKFLVAGLWLAVHNLVFSSGKYDGVERETIGESGIELRKVVVAGHDSGHVEQETPASGVFSSDEGMGHNTFELPSMVFNSDSTAAYSQTGQHRFARTWTGRQLLSPEEFDEDTKCKCVAGTGFCTVCVIMPILLACLLPTKTLHVRNVSKYAMTVSCPGSVVTIDKHAHGTLHCSSPVNGGNLYGYLTWGDSGIKSDYASGHVVNEASRNGNMFKVSVSPCVHDCSSSSRDCDSNGKNCHQRTTYYDETVTWTAVVPAPTYQPTPQPSVMARNHNLRGYWNGVEDEYISEIAPGEQE